MTTTNATIDNVEIESNCRQFIVTLVDSDGNVILDQFGFECMAAGYTVEHALESLNKHIDDANNA